MQPVAAPCLLGGLVGGVPAVLEWPAVPATGRTAPGAPGVPGDVRQRVPSPGLGQPRPVARHAAAPTPGPTAWLLGTVSSPPFPSSGREMFEGAVGPWQPAPRWWTGP
uniref:Putative secreted protein n=1 Tax=Ixodes ricinus TaxID=34613 RepID=A0A6B0UI62_IXORI